MPPQKNPDPPSLANRLREGVTVLDEPVHREAIAEAMLEAAATLDQQAEEIEQIDKLLTATRLFIQKAKR